MSTVTTDRYHHGDLPNALRKAATEVIAERGLPGFSLREVARRAGVSHTAPAHHFGDVRGLFTSLAAEGFEILGAASRRSIEGVDDPVEQLSCLGEAYVEFARAYPAHAQLMFRGDLIDEDDACVLEPGLDAYSVLEGAVKAVIDAEDLTVDHNDVTWLCWSAMQGLVVLEPKIQRLNALGGGGDLSTAELIRRFTSLIVNGVRGCRK